MMHPWYQKNWSSSFRFTTDQNVKSYFQNDQYGFRMATSTGGQVTGEGGDVLIQDDPINPKMANSEVELQNAIDYYEQTLYSRLNEHDVGLRIIIMQRLHEDDISGHLLAKAPDKYRHICFPGEESEDINPPDCRKYYVNGLFDPVRLPPEVLADHKENLTIYGYSGQILQRPSPDVGGMFKKYNWCFWLEPGQDYKPVKFKNEAGDFVYCKQAFRPTDYADQIQTWDMSFKDTAGSSFVSGGHWARSGPNIYLFDEVHKRLDYPGTVDAVKDFSFMHPQRSGIFIEDKANGPAVIADLGRTISGIIPIKADTDKVTRATPLCRGQTAQNIYLPHPEGAPWVLDFIDEFAKFPKGKHDDRVDMSAHAYNQIHEVYEYENIDARI
jgi:predicted phage terminase large subunit-like protein